MQRRFRPLSRRLPFATAFTLIEMLVVISIIVVLIGILVPVIGKVREKAFEASTKAQIGAMSAIFQNYYNDHKSYPGIVSNGQLRQPTCNITGAVNFTGTMAAWTVGKMTMNENAFLSLCGGLEPTAPGAQTYQVNRLLFGNGPKWLGTTPRKINAYTDMTDVKLDGDGGGHYSDNDSTPADDTIIPEFVDRFPDRMPLLILRARAATPGVCTNTNQDAPAQQYDLDQIRGYTDNSAAASGTPIGTGRKILKTDYKGGATYPQHGLMSVTTTACIGAPPNPNPLNLTERYPYDLYAALIDPNITRKVTPDPVTNLPANKPRQMDQYIIISAGIDRVYGTADDITNFGKW